MTMPDTPLVKGWCPGALRPMLSGDGWIVRVRPPEGRLTVRQVRAIADLAEDCGNGLVQLTNRANLQLRGIRPEAVSPLVAGLADAGLVDPGLSAEAEARLNLLVDPYWDRPLPGRPMVDTIDLWHRLRKALVAADAPALSGKFGFALDTGFRSRQLGHDSADIRIETAQDDMIVRADGMPTGRIVRDVTAAVDIAVGMAHWFVASGGVGPDGRGRMRDHIARGAILPAGLGGEAVPSPMAPAGQRGNLVTPAFGQIDAATLRALVAHSPAALRPTPWRDFHLPSIIDEAALRRIPALILDRDDPRLRATACQGAPGCSQAQGPTRPVAQRLAPLLPAGATLHVSGCAKGCAHPGAATVTLVARGNGCHALIRHGTAADVPETLLSADMLPSALVDQACHAPQL